MIRWIRKKLLIKKVVAQQNRPDASYEEHGQVSIERNSLEDSLTGVEKKMYGLMDQQALEDGEVKMNGIAIQEASERRKRKKSGLVDGETSKDEEIKLLKHQLYKKDEEIRRHQKAMKTICSDLKFALEAAKELKQQENPWLNESTTGFMFHNLENAYATAQFGELNKPYWWRGNEDLLGAAMSHPNL